MNRWIGWLLAAIIVCEVIVLATGHLAARITGVLSTVLFNVPWLMSLDMDILKRLARTAVTYYYVMALVGGNWQASCSKARG